MVDTVANNLANADTLAFKKDMPAFREYMATLEREHGAEDIPRGPIKDKDFYPLDGRDQSFVVTDGTYTNFRQGNLRVTQSPLDIAVDGPGFIEVNTPVGVRYTRQGSLKIASDGRLVNTEGHPVLLAGNNEAPAARFINLRDRGNHLTIAQNGEIYSGDQLVGKLSVVEFKDLNKLRKVGSSLYENKDPANVEAAVQKTIVRQGVLETSNVNPIEEMTNLIKANRLFEQDMKAIKTYNDLMGREANDIGKL
jgi:flagellar basal-body rod protein FlgG